MLVSWQIFGGRASPRLQLEVAERRRFATQCRGRYNSSQVHWSMLLVAIPRPVQGAGALSGSVAGTMVSEPHQGMSLPFQMTFLGPGLHHRIKNSYMDPTVLAKALVCGG
jgi:hypothetical protein